MIDQSFLIAFLTLTTGIAKLGKQSTRCNKPERSCKSLGFKTSNTACDSQRETATPLHSQRRCRSSSFGEVRTVRGGSSGCVNEDRGKSGGDLDPVPLSVSLYKQQAALSVGRAVI